MVAPSSTDRSMRIIWITSRKTLVDRDTTARRRVVNDFPARARAEWSAPIILAPVLTAMRMEFADLAAPRLARRAGGVDAEMLATTAANAGRSGWRASIRR